MFIMLHCVILIFSVWQQRLVFYLSICITLACAWSAKIPMLISQVCLLSCCKLHVTINLFVRVLTIQQSSPPFFR